MNGRDKCELLNQVRKKIAEKNNIEFDFEECTFEGDCSGTCPKCEAEIKYLERELKKKQWNGEKIILEGIFDIFEEPECIDISEMSFDDRKKRAREVLKMIREVEKEEAPDDCYRDEFEREKERRIDALTDEFHRLLEEDRKIHRTAGIIMPRDEVIERENRR